MTDKANVITDHILRVADRPQRVQAVIELAQRLDIDAKVKTSKTGATVITIPAKGGK